MTVHPINPPPPDRLSALDIVALTDVEVRAVTDPRSRACGPRSRRPVAARCAPARATPGPGADPAEVLGFNRIKLDREP